jgi:hypothetical protein
MLSLWTEVVLWILACSATITVLIVATASVTKCPEDFPENGYTKYPEPLRRRSKPVNVHRRPYEPRPVGKNPVLAAPYGDKSRSSPRLVLTPRDLSRINSVRRTRGLQPLNERGFRSAIAAAPVTSTNSSDWFPYLIAYEIIVSNHSGLTPLDHIVIAPEAPFNGQGAQYGGAGASGDWSTPDDGMVPAAAYLAPAAPQRVVDPPTPGYFPSDPPPAMNPNPIWTPDPVNPCTAGLSAASAVADAAMSDSPSSNSSSGCGDGGGGGAGGD